MKEKTRRGKEGITEGNTGGLCKEGQEKKKSKQREKYGLKAR